MVTPVSKFWEFGMGKRGGGIGAPGGGSLASAIASAVASRPAAKPRTAPLRAQNLPTAVAATSTTPRPAGILDPGPGTRRGSLAVALAAAASDEQMEAAVQAVVRDPFAPTTTRARASWLRTWTTLHEAAYASVAVPPSPFPLSCDSILRVSALFKAGGYLSFENYMYRAKSEHLALGLTGPGAWSPELAAAMRDAIRSCSRGTGIARQSRPIDAVAVAGLGVSDDPLVANGPVAPADFVVAGVFFMLREIELVSALFCHVKVSENLSLIHI